jgi:hypothetical protein
MIASAIGTKMSGIDIGCLTSTARLEEGPFVEVDAEFAEDWTAPPNVKLPEAEAEVVVVVRPETVDGTLTEPAADCTVVDDEVVVIVRVTASVEPAVV